LSDDAPATAVYTDATSGGLCARRYRVAVLTGPDAGKEKIIEGGTLLVGTHPNNDLHMVDKGVSRYHLELQLRADGLLVTDVGSTNGTFQGHTRINSVVLAAAAKLRLGSNTEIEIVPDDVAIATDHFASDRFGKALGASPPMKELFGLLDRVAPTEATVLLSGETGTGKELLAEAIHTRSARAQGPFIVVDCGALPRELIGSELFGHAKGAFTGASGAKKGLVEEADGGTLFLDEIGELPLELQPQLLRVLEKREVRPVGENKPKKVSIRVVAATHVDLAAAVRGGTFREDLYFRLAVVKATIPPLRARKGDLALLVQSILGELGRDDFHVPRAVLDKLAAHDWPGNVRELRNVVEGSLSLSGGALSVGESSSLSPAQVSAAGLAPQALDLPFKEAKGMLVEAFEREYLTHLLDRHKGNISRAAQEAGIDRNYIHRLVKKYNIPVARGEK
jgi:transcriptional regulator with PAS, ATPase and Fis domain